MNSFFYKAGGENATFCVAVLIKGRDMRVEGPVMDETGMRQMDVAGETVVSGGSKGEAGGRDTVGGGGSKDKAGGREMDVAARSKGDAGGREMGEIGGGNSTGDELDISGNDELSFLCGVLVFKSLLWTSDSSNNSSVE